MTEKLLRALGELQTIPLSSLLDVNYVAELIRRTGLHHDDREIYGNDEVYMNSTTGLWQIPAQLASALVFLSRQRVKSLLEVGTFSGWTISFITAYLLRFNSDLQAITIDPQPVFDTHPLIAARLPLYIVRTTAQAFDGNYFDLCFIDSDHAYHSVANDYQRVGQNARICMFHDINDRNIENEQDDGGTVRFWHELKQNEPAAQVREYTQHSQNDNIMGIGIRIKNGV